MFGWSNIYHEFSFKNSQKIASSQPWSDCYGFFLGAIICNLGYTAEFWLNWKEVSVKKYLHSVLFSKRIQDVSGITRDRKYSRSWFWRQYWYRIQIGCTHMRAKSFNITLTVSNWVCKLFGSTWYSFVHNLTWKILITQCYLF